MKKISLFFFFCFLVLNPGAVKASSKTVIVGIYENKPMVFMGKSGPEGLFVDLLEDIAGKEDWDLIYRQGKWDDLFVRVKKNQIDILPVVAFKAERTDYLDYSSDSLIANWGQVYTRKGLKMNSIEDLAGMRIATQPKDVHGNYFRNLLDALGLEYESIFIKKYTGILSSLESGDCDAGVVNYLNAKINSGDYQVQSTPIVFNPIRIHYAVPRGDPAGLLPGLDTHIPRLKSDQGSVYHKSMARWFGQGQSRPGLPEWVKWIFGAAAVVFLLLLGGNLILRVQVRRKTCEVVDELNRRMRAEEILKESEEKYRTMIEGSNDMIWSVDRDGNFVFFNARCEEITGLKADEWMGRSFVLLVMKEELPMIQEVFRKNLKGESVQYEFRLKKQDESLIIISVNTAGLVKKGRVEQVVCFGRDITARKNLESQLQQTQKMEALGTLAGGIAHDFNNILSGMMGYSKLAKIHINEPDNAGRHIDQIMKGARKASELVQQILTFSRQTEYEKKAVDINKEVEEALNLLRSSLPAGIEMKKKLGPSAFVLGDPVKIHQVVMNLCTNACHAMKKTGGSLEISLSEAVMSEAGLDGKLVPGNYLKLSVKDTGHGMDEKTLEKAFDPYYTTKAPGEGTGMGLPIVQAIVDEHGGVLDLCTGIGKGTSISIFFPVITRGKELEPTEAKAV